MTDLTLRQIEHFIAVVETESITEAARRLHISPGGISVSLSQLEDSLGVQLTLRKRGRGVAITPSGRWMYEQCTQVREGVSDMLQAARIMRGELAGPLRIGCYLTLSPWLLPRIAAHFSNQHTGVALHFVEGGSAELQDLLGNGQLDAALLYENHLRHGMDGEPIATMKLQLAFPPTHPLAELDRVPLDALKDENAILLDMQPSLARIESIFEAVGLRPKVLWRSNNVETIRSMVARGLGYTILMGRPYGDYTYDGLPLAYRKIADPIPVSTVVLALPAGTRPTKKITTLLQFCQSEFGDVDGDPGA